MADDFEKRNNETFDEINKGDAYTITHVTSARIEQGTPYEDYVVIDDKAAQQALAKAAKELGEYGKPGNTPEKNAVDLLKGRMDLAIGFLKGRYHESQEEIVKITESAQGPLVYDTAADGHTRSHAPTLAEIAQIRGVVDELDKYRQDAFGAPDGANVAPTSAPVSGQLLPVKGRQ